MIIVGINPEYNCGDGQLPAKSHGINCMSIWFMIEVSRVIPAGRNNFSQNKDILHISMHKISDHDVCPYIIEVEL
jgi:hypothetical protein